MTTALAAPTVEERLDRLSSQMEVLVAEAERQRARAERLEELTEVMMPIARQAMDTVGTGLADLDLETDDLVRLGKTLATSLPRLEAALAAVTPLTELGSTLTELSAPALSAVTDRLGELERRGYFDFARSGLGVVDRVITSFSEEDVEALGENIVLILQTVREMTQPEVMGMVGRTIQTVQEQDGGETEPPSMLRLLKQMRDPDVRRGLARMLTMLRSMGNPTTGDIEKGEGR